MSQQAEDVIKTTHWESKHHAFEEVPSNVQANGQPQLAGQDVWERQE
jgi:hypothetical protein